METTFLTRVILSSVLIWVEPVVTMSVAPGRSVFTIPEKQMTKLPRNLRGGEITNVRRRLDAVSTAGGGLPIPKGPMPTSSRSVRRQR